MIAISSNWTLEKLHAHSTVLLVLFYQNALAISVIIQNGARTVMISIHPAMLNKVRAWMPYTYLIADSTYKK